MFSPKLQALGIFPYKLLVDLPYIYDSLCQLYQAKRDTNNRSTNKRLSKTCSKNPSTKLEVGRTQEFYQLHPISFPFLDSKRPSQLLELHPQKCNNMNNDTLLFNFSYDHESESEVVQLCPTLCNPMDCSPPGSPIHGILQARILDLGCHFLLQGIFPTQGSNLGLLHCSQTLYPLSHQRIIVSSYQ